MDSNRKKLILTIAIALMQVLMGRAASFDEEAVVSLTIADGLSGETVRSVMTDHNGGTWIATNSGVNVFNGRQLHTISLTGEDGRSLEVYALCEVASQTIYMATEAGLYCIKKDGNGAKRVLPEVKQPHTLMARGDTLYIGSQQGLMVYYGGKLKHQNVDVSHHGLDNIVRQYAVCEKGRIWFLGRFDLNSYDPKTERVTHYKLPAPVNGMILSQFACLGNSRFAVGTRGNGLFLCDLKNGTAERVADVGNIVSTVQRSADGSVCVATDGAGAYRLKVNGERLTVVEHFHTEGDASHRLPSNGTYCYYRDDNGVNWFGFVRYGLAYTYHSGSLFEVFKAGDFTTDGLNVRTYCRHGDDVLLGTQNGFWHVNAATGASWFFSPEDLGGGHIVNTIAWYENHFYIGTFDGGLRQYNPNTRTLTKQTFAPILDGISIGDVKAGPDGRLWIGCSHGLIIVGNDMVQQHFTEQNSRIIGGLILSITFDQSGNAWLTGEKGCSLYSVRSHEIVETTFPKGFFHQQPWMRGAQGHDGLVFFRTGPQTFYTNEGMTDFGELKLPIKFTDKWCRSFVDDRQGHYLLGSERGIFAFGYDLTGMVHFGYGEGLRGDFINDMGLDPDGQVWVATSQGLFFTNYKKSSSWKQDTKYKVQLFDIRRGSDLLPIHEEYLANEERKIRLGWNMTSEVLQAEVMLPDYAKQEGRLYEYRIGGGDWQTVNDGEPIDVRGLVLGKHLLEVRLAGAQGTASIYTITVIPSGWATFELVLFIIAIVLLWLWWRFRKTTKVLLSERDEIEDALIESEELRVKSEEFAAALQEGEATDGEAVANSTLYTLHSSLNKYQKVKVDEEECAAIVKRMKEYLERERVYTNADLKMKDLADVLHLSAPKLSQVFNIYLGQNYYDFINGYRLDEFKRLIDEGEYKRYTITALSEQCGFKKSNFFSTFRKVEGMTPVEFLKKKGVSFK